MIPCNCLCHTSGGAIKHVVPCCCPHRIKRFAECPQCKNGRAR